MRPTDADAAMRLIDSETAFRFLTDQLVKETGAFSKGVNKGLNIARSAMRNPDAIPTIDTKDLRLVVRCRECKHWYKEHCTYSPSPCFTLKTPADYYCPYGKPKEKRA